MRGFRRGIVPVVVGVVSMLLAFPSGRAAREPTFPAKALTLIVAYSAGGGTDITARLLARQLGEAVGRPVIVQNITGGGGWTGWSALAHARPDGYTLGYLNIPNMFAGYLNPAIGRPERLESYTLLMNHVTDYCVWAVRVDSAFRSIADVIAAAKRPRGVSINAHGYANDDHLAILAMQKRTGVTLKVVHNKGTADSKAQVLGGHVDVLGANVSEVAAEHASGELRVLGVMSPTRSQFLPDVPTFREQGFPEDWFVSRGIAAPRGLAKDRVDALIQFLETAMSSEGHRTRAARLRLVTEIRKGRSYASFLKATEQEIKTLMHW